MKFSIERRCPARIDEAATKLQASTVVELTMPRPCERCRQPHPMHVEGLTPSNGLLACLACGHLELYEQKDFPKNLGLALVVLAAILAPFTSYVSLLAAAMLDAAIYLGVRDVVVCYVCEARHRGFASEPRHPRFDREIAERLRFGARAVMGKPMRSGGTAGAPDPEH